MVSPISLDGEWLFRPDPHQLGEHYPAQLHYSHSADARWCEPNADLSQWHAIAVPGLWNRQGHADLQCGWYRRQFARPEGERLQLIFDGVDYFADVWLNGHYLGSHEGYLGRFDFDVSDLLGEDNALIVRVHSPDDVPGREHEIGQMKHMFRGALERWDMNDPESKPSGIWGSVSLRTSGSARIEQLTITGTPKTFPPISETDRGVPLLAQVSLALSGQGAPADATIHYTLRPLGFIAETATGTIETTLGAGQRTLSFDITLSDAKLWWTWDLGQQRRYELDVTVSIGGVPSDHRCIVTGFRDVRLAQGWDLRLNGVKLFQRGANYLSDLDLSSMTAERYNNDLALMRQANLNTVHPFCLLEGDAFYDACDAAGLIVYQDFPIWMMSDPASAVVRAAIGQFDAMRNRHGHHPSIAIWNFDSQPSVANFEKLCSALVRHSRQTDPSRIAHFGNSAISYEPGTDVHPVRSFFWTENSAERFEERYDWRRDCHMYPGWYFGDLEAIAEIPEHHFPLVTEFGAQSLPRLETLATFIPEGAENAIPWASLSARCAQPFLLQKHFPDAKNLEELIEQSQAYQAELVRHHVEFIRARKDAPNHGLHLFAFNDCWPSVTWSVVEYDRVPKPAFHALSKAMEPVQAFVANYRSPLAIGQNRLAITLVNDTAAHLINATIELVLNPSAGQGEAIPLGDIEPTSVTQAIELPCHFDTPGQHAVRLITRWTGGTVENNYVLTVSPAP